MLLVPAIAVVALASIIVDDRDAAYAESQAGAEIAAFAAQVADLDAALGNEALASAAFSDEANSLNEAQAINLEVWGDAAAMQATQEATDASLQQLIGSINSSDYQYQRNVYNAILTVQETLAYRSDITAGWISPLQIADRYAYIRNAMLTALGQQTQAAQLTIGLGPISGLSDLVRARSAHLDERLTIELAIRYDGWAPGQHAAAIRALAAQEELLTSAHVEIGSSGFEAPASMSPVRSMVTQTMDVPPLTRAAWLSLSDEWLARLDVQIAHTTSAIQDRFATAERAAATDRIATVASVGSTLLFAALMAVFVVIRLVKRVGRVTQRALVLAADASATTTAIADKGRDEIGQLSTAFDDMAAQIRLSSELHTAESAVLESVALGEPIDGILETIALLLGVDDLGQPYYSFSYHAPAAGVSPIIGADEGTPLWLVTQTGLPAGEIPPRIETSTALALAGMAQARFDDDARIQFQIRHDRLTGLLGRGTILDFADSTLERSGSSRVGLFFVDLDGFKPINDTYGHAAGDTVLRAQSRRLGAIAATNRGSVGRLGGDEFLVVVPRVDSNTRLVEIADDIVSGLSGAVQVDGGIDVSTGTSVGCVLADKTMRLDQWIHEADVALYEAKRSGRGGAVASTKDLRDRAHQAEILRDEVQHAVASGQFVPFFQPVWSDCGRELAGFEALARWDRPGEGIVSPGLFLPVIEELKLASRFDGVFFETVCRQVAEWADRGLGVPYVSINVSAARLEDPDFVGDTLGALERTGCDPVSVIVEVTEEGVMTDVARNGERLEELRKAGLRVAADDFGKGYSSLAYLHQLPVDVLKIDRQFVDFIDQSRTNRAIVAAVRELASAMDLTLIAEGVERQEELDQLAALGCTTVQGFLLGVPAPLHETEVLIGMHATRPVAESEGWFASQEFEMTGSDAQSELQA